MAEKERPLTTLRVRNVTCYRRGAKLKGSLTLDQHHLTFTHAVGDPPGDDVEQRRKPKTKTIWLGYPLVNRCVLRPSHVRGHATTLQAPDGDDDDLDHSEDAFPPVFGTSAYGRPSTDSAHLAPYSSPRRPASPAVGTVLQHDALAESGRSPAIRIQTRDFRMMAFHFHQGSSESKSADDTAREAFFLLRSRCCVEKVDDLLAFHYQPPPEEKAAELPAYDARKEFARMGIGGKAPEGPGSAWRISDINCDYAFSATYPSVLCVPRVVSDNMLKYGGVFRSRARIPTLSYLHFNGGSITRSSQPLTGIQGKRNPQDERLVSAIFSSHTPPTTPGTESPPQLPSLASPSTTTPDSSLSDPATLDSDRPRLSGNYGGASSEEQATDTMTLAKRRVYGSTRRNLIVDARPKLNAIANRATGGGIEDVSNYAGTGDVPVEKVLLNIQNIHVMRASLDKVIESFGNADYVGLPPDQDTLRRSGWLGHIAGVLDGAELIARAVGLTGSHALIHCSDGWDRTAQVAALAQIMLDPHYRTLNGFITLVQKDFLSFGHKFRDRNGILGSEKWFEIENERIVPSRGNEDGGSPANGLNAFSTKALSGAKSWFDKNRANLFRQQNNSQESFADGATRSASPPPNPILHSSPTANSKDEKGRHTSQKEISPVFHQFLDSVYQLQRHHPNAFEFNERFLLRLLYQVYAGQYGEFLFNCERERMEHAGKLPSVWIYFTSRRADFVNPEYHMEEPLMLPKRGADHQIDVRWWYNLFSQSDSDMNVPRALAPVTNNVPTFNIQPSSLSLDDSAATGAEKVNALVAGAAALRETKSTPALSSPADVLSPGVNALSMQSPSAHDARPAHLSPAAPPRDRSTHENPPNHPDPLVSSKPSKPSSSHPAETEPHTRPIIPPAAAHTTSDDVDTSDFGDPLGVTTRVPAGHARERGEGLDFAGFAGHGAFRE
ncbi:phosphatidylinositol-3-phosphatase ymr1 [Friedmanniomyces endolithicus]|uniref:Phosphatidylinositol-3-phosphatase ymr1 n=1 Tax=Friedmanniomyces endolithicus TaxID=329885 RepID=A0AAN6QRI3_9PEZI|nr:phosphatidylinositol-3-phosphatase ymr1 [Friedmanniomyces endolithicus]KAK0979607.1 phosphatidylinositol-3-phosphatase ymr1 [Friedmanniomyces endolithicus]KAK0988824.1 phosphatidylinositol-3-phosphatase ymr1 [Friedmanniomyces endolithicus]KAK1044908.1 phosphatidylinositol-3-phosphatase ymr1 [Friedmanniomyces endolithicus]